MDIHQVEGLSSRKVKRLQKKYGYNELPDREKKNFFQIIFGIITEPMILLLSATVVIYFFLGNKNEALLLLISFFGIIGIELYQESKTEKSLQALKNLSSPICDVIRDAKKITIPGREVVVGDIILISEGSRVPADAKLISAENLKVDESLLTGESVPIEKSVRNIVDYKTNSIFSGTLVVKGHGIAEVTSIGLSTEIGKIGTSLKSIEIEKTLLQKEVNKVVKVVASLAVGASLILVLIYWLTRGDILKGLLAGLTLSIAILPEEFPVVLTIFLTLGAWRLAKNNVLARRSHTIETLGSASVLCVDKTGTLTENQMEIVNIIDRHGNLHDGDFKDAKEIVQYGVLASQKNPFDPMEEAFIIAGEKYFRNVDNIYKGYSIIKEYPLEDGNLSMVNIWGVKDRIEHVALKGAPEAVYKLCKLNPKIVEKIDLQVKHLANQGLRVIAVASGVVPSIIPKSRNDIKFDFLGLVGLADPIRREVPAAVEMCERAGVRVVMITGDHPDTAMYIAKKIGLDAQGIITGLEFEDLDEKSRKEIVGVVSIFCRVTPSNKLTIVNALKDAGEVVGMTGDGVNDAPALKSAHVGIAMGKKGTDVAREAASIVLLDDNFASIARGVRLGRRIYDNLQKAMSYIISVHIPIAALSLIPVVLKWPEMLIPAHIVFLEFVIDPSCTIIFENEKEEKNIMDRPPRKLNQSIFSRRMVISSAAKGLIVAVVVVVLYKILLDNGWSQDRASALTFVALVVANLTLILGISGSRVFADIVKRENMAMVTVLFVTILSLGLILFVPALRQLFHFGQLTLLECAVAALIGAMSIIGIIPIKKLFKHFDHARAK